MNDKHTSAEKTGEVGKTHQEKKNKEKSAEDEFVDFIKRTTVW